ncbi:MOSC domain-containing protein [Saccharomonospora saliphila]|uniref:MOSC domain-containing protein n=1 Tax=Saccharomonospora saliphila TaxID=369829 RepID=UPI000364617C|nr:MOSC N-terminal beta barrel domain-containing protein [Saccharomonospora saliphila]
MVRVTGLFCYPVKGCAGVSLTEAAVVPAGIDGDRAFMVVDGDGVFRSQRTDPRMAVVRPRVTADGARLTLSAPGVEPVHVAVDDSGARRRVRMHRADYRGIDQGDEVAAWLSAVLGRECRLVRVPPDHDRVTGGETPGTSAFADSSAVLLVSDRSLDELNARLLERGGEALPVDRFRPNVVVDGWDEAHAEDRLRRFEVGQVELGFTKVAIRCVVTTVDQDTGQRTGPEPLRTLAGYRRRPEGVAFGVKFSVTGTGKVSVGDELRVSRWSES